jgi:hypothetical protein
MTPQERAEAIIKGFGIRDPKELDLVAIAMELGMRVEYRPLDGCEATLVGVGERAIATISPSSYPGRTRFSIGHELGHWQMHRGRSFMCRVDDVGPNLAAGNTLEREADEFASSLLMPSQLFAPALKPVRSVTFRAVDELARQFECSLLATALRVIRTDNFPCVLTCYRAWGIEWQIRSKSIPVRWAVNPFPDTDSMAADVLSKKLAASAPSRQPADVWYDNADASQYEVIEESRAYGSDGCLTLLTLDPEMLDAKPDWDARIPRRRPG